MQGRETFDVKSVLRDKINHFVTMPLSSGDALQNKRHLQPQAPPASHHKQGITRSCTSSGHIWVSPLFWQPHNSSLPDFFSSLECCALRRTGLEAAGRKKSRVSVTYTSSSSANITDDGGETWIIKFIHFSLFYTAPPQIMHKAYSLTTPVNYSSFKNSTTND